MTTVRIKDTDHGFKKLLADVKAASKGAGVSVGVHAKEGDDPHRGKSENPMTVLDVAIVNEFGLGVPERSFIRSWFDENPGPNAELLRKAVKFVLTGQKTLPEAFELIGLKLTGEIQKRISRGIPPPNAPSTIAEKGSSKPLIDSGQLRSSITYLVRDKPPT